MRLLRALVVATLFVPLTLSQPATGGTSSSGGGHSGGGSGHSGGSSSGHSSNSGAGSHSGGSHGRAGGHGSAGASASRSSAADAQSAGPHSAKAKTGREGSAVTTASSNSGSRKEAKEAEKALHKQEVQHKKREARELKRQAKELKKAQRAAQRLCKGRKCPPCAPGSFRNAGGVCAAPQARAACPLGVLGSSANCTLAPVIRRDDCSSLADQLQRQELVVARALQYAQAVCSQNQMSAQCAQEQDQSQRARVQLEPLQQAYDACLVRRH
jgi:hypothetical protein